MFWRLRDRTLDLSAPRVMAIINATPDSFFAGSRSFSRRWLAITSARAANQAGVPCLQELSTLCQQVRASKRQPNSSRAPSCVPS